MTSHALRRIATVLSGVAVAAAPAAPTGAADTDNSHSDAAHTQPRPGPAPTSGSRAQGPPDAVRPTWKELTTGGESRLRGVSAVSHHSAWVSGSDGTILRTVDGGHHWSDVAPAGTSELDFRDIKAFDERRAVALSIGPGEKSRIYVTRDGGASWTLGFRNADERSFYNCMDFFDDKHGLAVGDPVDGRFQILRTSDGGRSWRPVPAEGMPAALDGEYNFSASGTCLVAGPGRHAWFATGGAGARVFRTADGGRGWQVADTPLAAGGSAGVFSVAFRDARHGVAVGGDYNAEDEATDAAAVTSDGGRTWRSVSGEHAPPGYRSGAAYVGRRTHAAVTVGPSGSDLSGDGGRSWSTFDRGSFDAVDCTPWGACWASGESGRAGRASLRVTW